MAWPASRILVLAGGADDLARTGAAAGSAAPGADFLVLGVFHACSLFVGWEACVPDLDSEERIRLASELRVKRTTEHLVKLGHSARGTVASGHCQRQISSLVRQEQIDLVVIPASAWDPNGLDAIDVAHLARQGNCALLML